MPLLRIPAHLRVMDVNKTYARHRMHAVLWEVEETGTVSSATVDEFFSWSPRGARTYLEELQGKALVERLVGARYRLSAWGKMC